VNANSVSLQADRYFSAGIFGFFLRFKGRREGGIHMTGYAWESFITKLLDVGLNAAQGLIRIALLIVLAYVLTRLLRAGLNRLEILLLRGSEEFPDGSSLRATEKTETIPGAAGKRI